MTETEKHRYKDRKRRTGTEREPETETGTGSLCVGERACAGGGRSGVHGGEVWGEGGLQVLLGQNASWAAGTHVWSALLLAWWLTFSFPGDLWYKAMHTPFLFLPLKIGQTIRSAPPSLRLCGGEGRGERRGAQFGARGVVVGRGEGSHCRCPSPPAPALSLHSHPLPPHPPTLAPRPAARVRVRLRGRERQRVLGGGVRRGGGRARADAGVGVGGPRLRLLLRLLR
eukprot:145240-Rhodomonas_salina.1